MTYETALSQYANTFLLSLDSVVEELLDGEWRHPSVGVRDAVSKREPPAEPCLHFARLSLSTRKEKFSARQAKHSLRIRLRRVAQRLGFWIGISGAEQN